MVTVTAHFPLLLHGHYEILKLFKRLRLERGRERKNSPPPSSSERKTRSIGEGVSLHTVHCLTGHWQIAAGERLM